MTVTQMENKECNLLKEISRIIRVLMLPKNYLKLKIYLIQSNTS